MAFSSRPTNGEEKRVHFGWAIHCPDCAHSDLIGDPVGKALAANIRSPPRAATSVA